MAVRAAQVMSADEAVRLIRSGDTVVFSGVGGFQFAETVAAALEMRFFTAGEPRDITRFEPTGVGIGPDFDHLSHEGLAKRIISSWFWTWPLLHERIAANQIEAYSFPLGTLHMLIRETASGRSGYLTQVGLHSYVDPRVEGGKLNSVTKEDLVQLVTVKGEEHLWYKAFPINIAIIRGSYADEDGNISIEEEAARLNIHYMALAARRWGGKVICQVKGVVARGALNPKMVAIPWLLVDAIVVDPNQHQNETLPDRHIVGLDGQVRLPERSAREWLELSPARPFWGKSMAGEGSDELFPLTVEKVVARRAALELRGGEVVNIGAGVPLNVLLPLTIEEGVQDRLTVSVEHGVLGGVNPGGLFHLNPTSFLDYSSIFSLYYGGGLDVSVMGLAELDAQGNLNLTRYGSTIIGPGGSVDIGHNTKRLLFCGTFTADGLRAQVGEGGLRIVEEGATKRLVGRVNQISFSGPEMWRRGKQVLYITERAVFRLTAEGPELIEVAPGVDLDRDILGQMEFRPKLAPQIKTMDVRLFRPQPVGLKRLIRSPRR